MPVIFALVVSFFLVIIGFSGCEKIPSGNVGVVVNTWGSDKGVSETELKVGNWWVGFGKDVYVYPVFVQNETWADDKDITFQSNGMTIKTALGISYKLEEDKVKDIFQKYRKGNQEISDIYLRNMVQSYLIQFASKMSVEDVYGERKSELLQKVEDKVRDEVKAEGIQIQHLYWVGGLQLPDTVVHSINAKIEASQKALLKETEIQSAKADAQKQIEEARGRAESVTLEATAKANAIKITGDAEASAIKAKSDALNTSPMLVQYEMASRWDGKLPEFTGGNGSVPMINVPFGKQ